MNPTSPPPTRDAFLMAMGETIRTARARRGMTRRMLATEAGVSERHLANLESGLGNASILVLRQVAQALGCPLAELVDAKEGSSPEAALLRDLLRDRSENELQRARIALARLFGAQSSEPERRKRIALIGLRGAGKSTLGRMLADQLGGFPSSSSTGKSSGSPDAASRRFTRCTACPPTAATNGAPLTTLSSVPNHS